jgi:WD40 repeat protein
VVSISFSPDGTRLASASLDGTFLLWNVERGNPVLTVQNKAQRAEGQVVTPGYVAFNAKGDLLATLTDGELVPPFVNKSFPWKLAEYPAGEALQDRVEAYKRAQAKP